MESSDQSKVYYMFSDCSLHQNQKGTRATLAVEENNGEVRYGVAICQPNDNFNREVGREIALKRLKSGFGVTKLGESYFSNFKNERDAILAFSGTIIKSFENNPKKWWSKVDNFTKADKVIKAALSRLGV